MVERTAPQSAPYWLGPHTASSSCLHPTSDEDPGPIFVPILLVTLGLPIWISPQQFKRTSLRTEPTVSQTKPTPPPPPPIAPALEQESAALSPAPLPHDDTLSRTLQSLAHSCAQPWPGYVTCNNNPTAGTSPILQRRKLRFREVIPLDKVTQLPRMGARIQTQV